MNAFRFLILFLVLALPALAQSPAGKAQVYDARGVPQLIDIATQAELNAALAGGGVSLPATRIGFGSPSNLIDSDADLNFITATNTLRTGALSLTNNGGIDLMNVDVGQFQFGHAASENLIWDFNNAADRIDLSSSSGTKFINFDAIGIMARAAPVDLPYGMPALAVDLTKALNRLTIAVDVPVTLTGSVLDGQRSRIHITNTDTNAHTITLPAGVLDANTGQAVTAVSVDAASGGFNGQKQVTIEYTGLYYLIHFGNSNGGTVPWSSISSIPGPVADLADGSLSGSLVGSGIAAGNITSGNLAVARFNGGAGATSATYWAGDGTWKSVNGGLTQSTFTGTGTYAAGTYNSGNLSSTAVLTLPITSGQAVEFDLNVPVGPRTLTFSGFTAERVGFLGTAISGLDLPAGRHWLRFHNNGTVITVRDSKSELVDLTTDTTGTLTLTAGYVETPYAMPALAINVAKARNVKEITGNVTMTMSGTPVAGQVWGLEVYTADPSSYTVSIPTPSLKHGFTGASVSGFTVPANGRTFVKFVSDGTNYFIYPPGLYPTDIDTSAELAAILGDENGTSGGFVRAVNASLTTPNLGTPSALILTNATGLPVAGGGTGGASFTPYAPIFGGSTSTAPLQSGTVGASGEVWTSNGPGVAPSFQAASGGSGAPTADGTAIVKGSADATKLLRFEVDGLTASTTRVITPPDSNTSLPIASQTITFTGPTAPRTVTLPDSNIVVARTDAGQTFSGTQTFPGQIYVSAATDGIKVGTGTTASVDSQILIARAVDNATAGNGHAFSDSSTITRTGSIGYNSYDGRVTISSALDHYADFQALPTVTTGTTPDVYSFYAGYTPSGGTVTNWYGANIGDIPSGAGSLGTFNGVYIKAPLEVPTTADYGLRIAARSAATSKHDIWLEGDAARLTFGAGRDLILTRQTAYTGSFYVDSASPVSTVFRGPGGVGTNIAGGGNDIAGGPGTGSGVGGPQTLSTYLTGSSGSSQNSKAWRNWIEPREKSMTESTATVLVNISLASGKYCGGRITATTHADDGTDYQAVSESFTFSAINKAGTVTATITASPTTSTTAASSGTLTTTWTAVANGAGVDIKNSAVSSLTQTTLKVQWQMELNGDASATITP